MSGAWARACDAQDVSSDVNSDRHAGYAVLCLGQAMVTLSTFGRMSRVEYAGAHIRAWRKSLPVQSRRVDDAETVKPTKRLLWNALFYVYYAAQYRENSPSLTDPAATARALRQAEAALRTWHKRQEQP